MGFLGIKFKSKNQAPRKPHVAADDLVSNSRFRGIYGLCEGEIYGLADGVKSIRLDGTPIVNSSGQPNFAGVNYEFRTGTVQQEYIKGFASVENEINIGVELRHDRPFVRQINNAELSAVRVRLNFNSLRQQHDNGDITGYAIEYAIDLQVEGGAYQEVLKNTVRGKASSGFKKSHRIDLPKGKRWTLRVRRITPNRNSELIADTTTIDAITEIIDAKLRYPCTALLGLSYDAKTFNNIAKVAVRLKGAIIRVPSNYNPETRTYNGLWDGAFKKAYSNNPAWVFYDVCTHERYGLGNQLASMVDKWRLYQIGQYCDELVDDGRGGKEPRFTVNVYLQKDEEAYRVLQSLASVFRGMNFWDGQNVIVDSDTPKDAVYTFTPANVVGGEFNYSGTRARDRHNIAKVAWDNPDNDFKTEYEFVKDEAGIAKYGIHQLELNAFGCTSQGQAQRAGLWALKSEQLETRSVTFKTGLQGFIPQVGQVINIADNVFAGRAISGRIVAINGKQITLDRPAGKVGDTFTANHDGIKTAKIVLVKNSTITLDKSLDLAISDVWAIISDDLKLMQFKVLAVKQNDDNVFEINALQHEPQKYQAIDSGANITQATLSVLQATLIEPPSSVTLTSQNRTHQGQNLTTLTIAWSQVVGAVAYLVQWRKDDGNWQILPPVSGQSVDIDGVYQGHYLAQVIAIDAFDNQSLAAISPLTAINGKQGRPPKPTAISASGGLFSMVVSWTHAKGSEDANYTEVQVSPDGRSNIATLGQFAYPTNKHEITGLQGNLTQFYRARIVDKLGNASDWTAWTSGTTEARADKVLDIISGQIRDSHLDQTLRTPIGKIGGLENAVMAVNGNLVTLNNSLATARRELQTTTTNITTERNRITNVIRDITALQSANTAKTQEIANLTQTVGGHTSSIRELGVTTGDLTQKYSQLKTASDTANSEITAIKQTQAGQALSVERLGTKFDNLAVGSRNLLLNSGRIMIAKNKSSNWNFTGYQLSQALVVGQTYTFSADVNFTEGVSDKVSVLSYKNNNLTEPDSNIQTVSVVNGKITGSFIATVPNDGRLLFYAGESGRTYGKVAEVKNAKLERGTIATDWTPAPEDIQSQLDDKATMANLDTLRQTLTTADIALSQQITAMDTAYKQADIATTAKIGNVEKAVSDANRAIAQTAKNLNAKFDSLSVGGRNLLKNSNPSINSANYMHRFELTAAPNVGDDVVVTLWGDMGSDRTGIGVYNTQGYTELFELAKISDGVYQGKGAWRLPMNGSTPRTPNNTHLNVYFYPSIATSNNRIDKIKLERGTIATDWTPAPEDLQVDIDSKANTATLDEFKQAQATKDTATAQKLSQLESNLGQKANATALNELTTRVHNVDGKITAEANKIATMQTTVNSQTASIRNVEQSVNGVRAIKAVTVDNNGFISGYGLMSELQNGRVTSRFGVNADQIYFGATTTAKKPFVFTTRTTTIDGVSYPAGAWLNSASIANASIKLAHIDKASIGNLSALSANIGHFKSAQSGARLEIKDSVLLVYDANNTLRVRLGLW